VVEMETSGCVLVAPEDGQLTGRNICRADFLKL
jgi:hypothetical protein